MHPSRRSNAGETPAANDRAFGRGLWPVLWLWLCLAAGHATAEPAPGALLIADAGLDAVLAVDPDSGDRADVSSAAVGTGQPLLLAHDIIVLPDLRLLVADSQLDALVVIDPATGDRTIASCADLASRCVAAGDPFVCCTGSGTGDSGAPCAAVGTGPEFSNLQRVVHTDDGRLLATDAVEEVIFEIDLATGDRSILSGMGVGTGVALDGPIGLAIESAGTLLVADNFLRGVFRVDAATGDRVVLSANGTGAGPNFSIPVGIAVDATGRIFVSDLNLDAIVEVDPASGDRTVVSDDLTGAGPGLISPVEVTISADGDLLVSDTAFDALFRIELATGDRTVLSGCIDSPCSALQGVGDAFLVPYGPALFPALETLPALGPGAGLACALLLAVLGSARLARRTRLQRAA